MSRKNIVSELGFVRLDARKRTPLFRQLYDSIRTAILEGGLSADSRIPSSRDLVGQLGVSRTTVVTAIELLIAEGYLQTAVGSGTFVSKEIPDDRPFLNSDPIKPEIPDAISTSSSSGYLSRNGTQIQNLSMFPGHPGLLKPFRPGIPALDEFPIAVWSQLVRKTWKTIAGRDLSYGESAGYFPLRESIAEYLRAHRGVRCDADQVMIVNGTQQAFDIIARLTLNDGDQVLFENPGYVSARNAFEMRGAEIIPLSINEHGAPIEKTVEQHPGAKLVYVTPSHQYPLGLTMQIENRMELIKWAGKTNGLIVEDDYDSEYRYSQKPIPAMQGLDSSHRTIYVGSFSKVIYPALSLGYVIVPHPMIKSFEHALSLASRPPSLIDQFVLYDFIREGHFGRHLRRMRKTHSERRQTFVDELEKRIPDAVTIIGSQAGLHCTVKLHNGVSDKSMTARLNENGIIVRSLSDYYLPRTPVAQRINGLIFGFACATPGQIKTVVRKMSTLF